MGEIVNIVWNSHVKILRDGLWNYFQNKYKTDFCVSLDENQEVIAAHHLMFAIFCSAIRDSEATKLVINPENSKINKEDLHLLIEFMYLGKIKVARERLPSLQLLAEILGFGVLKNAIVNFTDKDNECGKENIKKSKSKNQKVSKSNEQISPNLVQNTEDLLVGLDDLLEENVNNNEEMEDVAEVKSDISDWETEMLKEKRRKLVSSRKAVNRAKKASSSNRVRLADSKIIPRNTSGSFVKYNVEKFYDPNRDGLVCRICDKVLKYKSTYVRHLRCHENPELYSRCNYCDYKSDTKNALIQHLAAKHKVDLEGRQLEKNIKCSECSYSCVSEFQLKNHVYVKHTTRGNVCSMCGYACKSRAVYEIHLKAVHGNNERPFMCETCGFRAKTLGVLRNHLKTHTDKKTCDVCGVWLTYHSFKAHMKLHTCTERPFPCHLCNFAARKKYNLKVHLKNVHKLEETYESVNTTEEDDAGDGKKNNTVTTVMINELGDQLISMPEQTVMEATFHMEIS